MLWQLYISVTQTYKQNLKLLEINTMLFVSVYPFYRTTKLAKQQINSRQSNAIIQLIPSQTVKEVELVPQSLVFGVSSNTFMAKGKKRCCKHAAVFHTEIKSEILTCVLGQIQNQG